MTCYPRCHLDSRQMPGPLRSAITLPATDVCTHVANTWQRSLPRVLFTAPSAAHLATCVRPGFQHPGLSVRAQLLELPLQRFVELVSHPKCKHESSSRNNLRTAVRGYSFGAFRVARASVSPRKTVTLQARHRFTFGNKIARTLVRCGLFVTPSSEAILQLLRTCWRLRRSCR